MTEKLNVILLVAARSGASGSSVTALSRVGGMPLIGRATRMACRAVQRFGARSRVVCLTHDAQLSRVSQSHGAEVPFLLPDEIGRDSASVVDSALHGLSKLALTGIDAVVLLHSHSPLLEVEDVVGAVALFADTRDPVNAITADGQCIGGLCVTTTELLEQQQGFRSPAHTRGFVVPAERALHVEGDIDLHLAESLLAARPVMPLKIGQRPVGPGHPCYIIAEAGVNHNGELDLARKMVDVAADAGADAVKFQVFRAQQMISAAAPQAAYQRTNTGVSQSQLEMVRRLEIDAAGHRELFDYCRSKSIRYLASPFDQGSVDLLCEMGVDAIKVGSGELTNHELLRYISRKGLPVLLSTGMSEMFEVDEAVDVVRREQPPGLGLFHCVSDYPAAPADCNLRALDTLLRQFSVPVGWSDHTLGIHVTLAAAGRGVSLVEKHFTVDRNLPGPDHRASIEPDELAALVAGIRDIDQALGDGHKKPTASESDTARVARRSLHASRDLSAGTVIDTVDLVALRPGTGIAANEQHRLIGLRLLRDVRQGQLLTEDDFGK